MSEGYDYLATRHQTEVPEGCAEVSAVLRDLCSSTEHFEALLSTVAASVFHLDEESFILNANEAAHHLLNIEPGCLIRQNLLSYCTQKSYLTDILNGSAIAPENGKAIEKHEGAIQFSQSQGTIITCRFCLFANRENSTYLLIANPAMAADSAPLEGAAAIAHPDIVGYHCYTSPSKADQLNLQSAALNACADVILITDRGGLIEWVNPAFTQLTGYTPAEAIGRNPRELVNSGKQDKRFFEQLWNTILSGKVWRGELINRRKDRSHYVEEMTITPVCDEKGNIEHFIAIKQDVTERKAAEHRQNKLMAEVHSHARSLEQVTLALGLSEQRYRSVVESQSDLICRFTPEGILTFVNKAYCAYFGRSAETLTGRNFVDLVPAAEQSEVRRQIEELQQLTVDNPIIVHEHKATTADGHISWHQWSNRALFDEQGNLVELQAIGRDITALKRAETELRDREQRLSLFFSQSLDGFFFMMLDEPIWWNDAADKEATLDYVFNHQRITKANQALLEQYGATEAEFLGLTPADFFAHDLEIGRAIWREFFDRGRLHVDTNERKLDGTPMWVEGDYICLYDDQGRITGHFGVQREVTENRQAIADLAASESNYRLLVENQTDLIVKVDPDGHFLFVSPSYCQLFDRQPEELLGNDFTPLIHPDDRASTQARLKTLWAPPHNCKLEQRALTRQGWRWLSWAYTAILDDAGNVSAIVGVGRDITDRKQMELQLQLSEQKFRNVLETLTLAAVMLDFEGSILFCNDYLLTLTGWQRDEVLGQNWSDLFIPAEIRATMRSLLRQTFSGDEFPVHYENEILTRSGERRLIAWNNTVQKDAEGIVISVTSIGEDITERKRNEQRIYQLSQRLSLATQAANMGIWEVDLQTGALVWDDRMFELYGLSSDTPITNYEEWLAYVHPEDLPIIDEQWAAINGGVDQIHYQFRILQPDGAVRHIESHAAVIRATDGTAWGLVGVNTDVSDRVLSKNQLLDISNRLSLAATAAELGIWDWDIVQQRLTWDERQCAIYGIDPSRFGGTYEDWQSRIHPEDWPKLQARIDVALRRDSVFNAEFRIVLPDGYVRHVEAYAHIQQEIDGFPIRMVGVNRDISDRKQSELALSEAHQRLQALMQNSPAVIGLYDETGCYHQVNAITEKLLGLPASDIVGRRFHEIYPSQVADLFMARIRQLIDTQQPLEVEDQILLQGEARIFRSVLFPVSNIPGQPRLFGTVATDITALISAQESLRTQADRERLIRTITENVRSSLDLNTILENAVDSIRSFLKVDRVMVYRFRPDWSGDITIESVDPLWVSVLGETIRDPCFSTRWVDTYRRGRIHQINDLSSADLTPCYRELLEYYQIQANLVLPLRINQTLWGLLCIHQCSGPRTWLEEEIELVQQIVDQVTIAVQQARLLDETTQRAQHEALRRRITQHIRQSLDLGVILETTVCEVRNFIQTDRVVICRLNADHSSQVTVESVAPIWPSMKGQTIHNPLLVGDRLQQFLQSDHFLIDDIFAADLAPPFLAFLEKYEIQAMLSLPLSVDGSLWGVLCIHQCRSPRHWDQDEVVFVRQIADQVEIAIQQAQLLQQTKIQVEREQILNNIFSFIRDSLDLDKILKRTTHKVLEALRAGRCITVLCSDADDYFEYTACATAPGIRDFQNVKVPLKGNRHAQAILHQDQPIATYDVTQEPLIGNLRPLARELQIGAMLDVAIRHEGVVKGMLCVHHPRPRLWTDHEQVLLKQVADQLAIAIQQAELYQQAQAEIAERQRLEEQLRHDALHDALTGLPNRALFLDRLKFALSRYQLHQQSHSSGPQETFAVLFLDLDRFKVINDSLGHTFGDQLLKLVGRRLINCLREVDIAARLGGDEFVILLEELSDVQFAIEVARRIHGILEIPIFLDDREIFIRASIGIALGSMHYSEPEQILRDADIAMYKAKKSNQEYVLFDAPMHAIVVQQMNLENDLRHAIKRGEFKLQYQPIVSLATGRISGFEALVRWHHPTLGLLMPKEFVELAEDTGLIAAIDLWVLQEACQQLHRWHCDRPEFAHLTMSVNLSGKQFSQPDLINQIDNALTKAHLDGQYLKLEITESVLITNDSLAVRTLNEFRARNIKVCMDDFGTGYSSLSYLHRFPVDILKIDKSFILNLKSNHASSRDYEIVKAIIHLALNLNLQVIAEGIENRDILVYLQKNNCQYGQGHYFSRAVDADAATQLLLNQSIY